ncbi:predicted protein [Pyrenophora tritici-repentis Pt-1C-BFP]|uniref:Uncharacterized protein n=1 Tax=Pyrenophora tritici-repentis (strain Pt-1C-BFP) TaxID=426418 RepID=B2WMQ7_PYRTR|nr:uncharacterized protein PTRG_11267 [Pyrenophora tritici-repentis Pt-1C-BFP]EDU44317.1 predicted protein [Pyrenophora tritici-repentis Pt-1C-BFP]
MPFLPPVARLDRIREYERKPQQQPSSTTATSAIFFYDILHLVLYQTHSGCTGSPDLCVSRPRRLKQPRRNP